MTFHRQFRFGGALLLAGLAALPGAGSAQGVAVEESAPLAAASAEAAVDSDADLSSASAPAAPALAPEAQSQSASVATFLALLGGARKADADLLEAQRGGSDSVLNDIHSSGVVTNNQAYNLSTGTNTIADGAFVGANGLSTVVQNSGNNVLIQNSTIINIHLQ